MKYIHIHYKFWPVYIKAMRYPITNKSKKNYLSITSYIPMEAHEGKVLSRFCTSFTDANPWKSTHGNFSVVCIPVKFEKQNTVSRNWFSVIWTLNGTYPNSWRKEVVHTITSKLLIMNGRQQTYQYQAKWRLLHTKLCNWS